MSKNKYSNLSNEQLMMELKNNCRESNLIWDEILEREEKGILIKQNKEDKLKRFGT